MELDTIIQLLSNPERLIKVSNKKFAIVDDSDFEKLNKFKWYLNTGYAVTAKYVKGSGRKNQKQIRILMHRLIINCKKGEIIDHINGNKLDNRKVNLRICNFSENIRNSSKRKNCISRFKGVSKLNKKWRCRLTLNYKEIHIGTFENEIQAAMAYDISSRDLYGEFAKLNFPNGLWN